MKRLFRINEKVLYENDECSVSRKEIHLLIHSDSIERCLANICKFENAYFNLSYLDNIDIKNYSYSSVHNIYEFRYKINQGSFKLDDILMFFKVTDCLYYIYFYGFYSLDIGYAYRVFEVLEEDYKELDVE